MNTPIIFKHIKFAITPLGDLTESRRGDLLCTKGGHR